MQYDRLETWQLALQLWQRSCRCSTAKWYSRLDALRPVLRFVLSSGRTLSGLLTRLWRTVDIYTHKDITLESSYKYCVLLLLKDEGTSLESYCLLFLKCLWYSYAGGKCRHTYTGLFFRKVASSRRYLFWIAQYMDLNLIFSIYGSTRFTRAYMYMLSEISNTKNGYISQIKRTYYFCLSQS
jgi:hypothetical protein